MALFIVWGYGEAVSILQGTLLGEGRIQQAKEESRYHLGLSFAVGLLLWLFMVVLSPAFLHLYSISDPLLQKLIGSLWLQSIPESLYLRHVLYAQGRRGFKDPVGPGFGHHVYGRHPDRFCGCVSGHEGYRIAGALVPDRTGRTFLLHAKTI